MNPTTKRMIDWVRTTIIELLESAQPMGMLLSELTLGLSSPQLAMPIDPADLLKDFDYLCELGLIERRQLPGEMERWQEQVRTEPMTAGPAPIRWRLTAKGKRFWELGMPWNKVQSLDQ